MNSQLLSIVIVYFLKFVIVLILVLNIGFHGKKLHGPQQLLLNKK